MSRRQDPKSRGFALIVVVMVVAAISLVAVTLLNFVNLDAIITGQGRETFEARAIADGAVTEALDNENLAFPDFATPGLRTVISDPYGLYGAPVADTSQSYYAPGGTTHSDEKTGASNLTMDLRLLGIGAPVNTGLNEAQLVYYEVRAIGDTNNREATNTVQSEVGRVVSKNPGQILPSWHAR